MFLAHSIFLKNFFLEKGCQNYNINFNSFVCFNYCIFEQVNMTFNYIFIDWYFQQNEPNSQAGTHMGLTVILDAHTDILEKYYVTDDFDGFTAIVAPPSDFPLINQQGFGIKTGKL